MQTDINNLCFIDSETRRVPGATIMDVTKVGAYRYARHIFPTLWAMAVGTDPVHVAAWGGDEDYIFWDDLPEQFRAFHERVERGEAWYVAWNMNFDRQIWNGPESRAAGFPELKPEWCLDAMAQAVASGLPAQLKHAARFIGQTQKIEAGRHLIKLFEPPNGLQPQDDPEKWEQFVGYGGDDVNAMRDVWAHTRPLSRDEWETYWVSERINDRGMGLDTRFCAATSVLVQENQKIMNRRLQELTGIDAVTKVAQILNWLDQPERLGYRQEARQFFVEKREVLNDDGTVKRPEKLSLSRDRIENALVFYEEQDDLTDEETKAVEVLEIRQWGGSNTPQKFEKALRMQSGGSLRGQYVFNGAPQTGRFSSRGVQIHNLTRSHLGEQEEDAIAFISDLEDERIEQRLEENDV